jgi:hypothetical protein
MDARDEDIIEFDELWSFCTDKANKQWIWTTLCRRTRQIVARRGAYMKRQPTKKAALSTDVQHGFFMLQSKKSMHADQFALTFCDDIALGEIVQSLGLG